MILMYTLEWKYFIGENWKKNIDVLDFITNNYKEYTGDNSFLVGPTEKSKIILNKFNELKKEELQKGVLDIETKIMSGIDNFNPGYIDKENEVIFGLQTDKPLKRIINPYGGMRMVKSSLASYGYELDKDVEKYFNMFRKTHNQGVFDAYTKNIRKMRSAHLLTGLPDAYGRGRIIGDYRRIALYGIDFLIEKKQEDLDNHSIINGSPDIRLREEISEQIRALNEIKSMANKYNFTLPTFIWHTFKYSLLLGNLTYIIKSSPFLSFTGFIGKLLNSMFIYSVSWSPYPFIF